MYAVGEGHDAGIAVESGNNEWRGHFFGRLAQLPQERVNDSTGVTAGACDWILGTVLTLKPALDLNPEKMPGQPT
jgi:hypothetical protein